MAFQRWYDKNEKLQKAMGLFEHANLSMQDEIADDIIQLIIDRQNDIDNFIQIINSQVSPLRRRWYDRNENLLSSVEMLKHLEKIEEKELLNEMINVIMDKTDTEFI